MRNTAECREGDEGTKEIKEKKKGRGSEYTKEIITRRNSTGIIPCLFYDLGDPVTVLIKESKKTSISATLQFTYPVSSDFRRRNRNGSDLHSPYSVARVSELHTVFYTTNGYVLL